jgi:hypothetical protein
VPDRIVLILCVTFALAGTLAAFRIMYWWLFVPALAVLLVVTWRFMPQSIGLGRSRRNGAIIALALAVIWFVVQIPLASQYMVPIRDAGIYMIVGAGIAHTGGTPIDILGAHQLMAAVPGLSQTLGPFGSYGATSIELQGSSGVPAILAIGYWIAGVQGEILVNLVVGAVGLLALYGLARRFMGPYWALLPSSVLGLAMPYLYFSRTSYTEIVATMLIIASATWLVSAFNTRRLSDFIVSGALMGASSLTRVDGALEFAGALAGLLVVMIGVGRTQEDRGLRWKFIAFAGAGWALLGIGIFDLLFNVPRYVKNLGASPHQLWEGAAAITVLLVASCLSPLGARQFQYTKAARVIARVAAGGLAALFLYWLSRPWWLIDHHIKPGAYADAVAALQTQDGLPLDPSRGYSEYSLWWFAWYFGWAFLALAIVGMCLWVYWAVTRRNAAHVVIIATVGVVAVLYIDNVNITPDQIWAFRRVLPAITPALVVAAVFCVRWLWKARRRWLHGVAVVAVIALVIGVFIPWGKIVFTVEGGGQAAEIEHICDAIGDAPVVAFVLQDAPANYAPTIREFCNTQVVTINNANGFDWKALATASKQRVAVVTWDKQLISWVSTPRAPTYTAVVTMWTRHLLEPPRTATITVRSVYIGRLNSAGRVAFSGSP